MSAAILHALAFCNHGLPVVPLWPIIERDGERACACGKRDCRSPGKHPIARLGERGPPIAPNGVLSASSDTGIVRNWWRLAPDANVAVSTASLIALDIDVRHDGLASLADLEDEHGKLPPTWTVRTGSGGLHFYLRRPEALDLRLPIIAGEIIRRGGIPPFGTGIDVPAYLVAPPSNHLTGGTYQWEATGHPRDVPLADAPAWVIERLKAEKRTSRAANDPDEWLRLTGGPIREYHDREAVKIAGKLARAVSIDVEVAARLLAAWNEKFCKPPISDEELADIFDRVTALEAARVRGRS